MASSEHWQNRLKKKFNFNFFSLATASTNYKMFIDYKIMIDYKLMIDYKIMTDYKMLIDYKIIIDYKMMTIPK